MEGLVRELTEDTLVESIEIGVERLIGRRQTDAEDKSDNGKQNPATHRGNKRLA